MILYFHLSPTKDDPDLSETPTLKNSDETRRQRQVAIVAEIRDTWVQAIKTWLLPETSMTMNQTHPGYSPPKLLVIVNPFSGKRKSEKILEEKLIPFLTEAGINFEVLVTQHAGHAREVIANESLSDLRGLVSTRLA